MKTRNSHNNLNHLFTMSVLIDAFFRNDYDTSLVQTGVLGLVFLPDVQNTLRTHINNLPEQEQKRKENKKT